MKHAGITLALLLFATAPLWADGGPRLHLLRSVEAVEDPLTVGVLAVVTGVDRTEADRIRAITVGRSPWPGEELRVARRTLLSRLAMCGVDANAVSFSGADQVSVRAAERTVTTEEIVARAREVLPRLSDPSIQYKVRGEVADGVVSVADGTPRLSAQVKSRTSDSVGVEVVCTGDDGRKRFARQITFRALRPVLHVVAVRDVGRGQTLTRADLALESVEVPVSVRRVQPDIRVFLGTRARANIPAGTALQEAMVTTATPEPVVTRNQLVRMRVSFPGLIVTSVGKALSPGCEGDVIKVRNMDSSRVVLAVVSEDGTVEPLLTH